MRFVGVSVKRDCLLEASKGMGWSLAGFPRIRLRQRLVLAGLEVSGDGSEAFRVMNVLEWLGKRLRIGE